MTPGRLGWTIRFGDRVWRESDLTLGQAVKFQELTGSPWPRSPIQSAQHLTSLLAVLIAGVDDDAINKALAQLAPLNMVDVFAMVEPGEGVDVVDVD